MFITNRRKIEAGIDMTPLIDVVFQLLIFLMVSSHFTKTDEQVELPTGQGEAIEVDQKIEKHLLSITSENVIILNGQEVRAEDFELKLVEEIKKTQVKRLEIRGDTSSQLGSFIDIIEKAKRAGIESMSYHKKASIEK